MGMQEPQKEESLTFLCMHLADAFRSIHFTQCVKFLAMYFFFIRVGFT